MRVGWSVFRHFRIARASHALSSLQSNHMHRTLYTPHSTLHFTRYTLHSTLRTRHFTHYILHSTLYTLHFTLYTPYLTLYSLHSSPTTRHQHPSATFTLRAPLLSLTPTSSPKQRPLFPPISSSAAPATHLLPRHQQPSATFAMWAPLLPSRASPQRARPSHALLHITLYTYTPRPGTPIRTMYFLLPFPFPLIFSSSSIAFLMF